MALVDGVIAAYHFDSASVVADATGGGRTLSNTGSVSTAAGKFSEAADFGGSNYLSHADHPVFSVGSNSRTFAFWYRPTSFATGFNSPITKDDLSTQREYGMYQASAGNYRWAVFSGASGSGFDEVSALVTLSVNTWYSVILHIDASLNQIGIQIDNGTIATASHSGGVYDGTADFGVGGGPAIARVTGQIDELVIWDRVLDSTDRAGWWNSGSGIAYPFSGGGGSPLGALRHHRVQQMAA